MSLAPSVGDTTYAVNPHCHHGAPHAGAAPETALAVSQLVMGLATGPAEAASQLELLESFVRSQPAVCRAPDAVRILVSAACDSFGDGASVSITFLKAAAFLEAWNVGGEGAFLAAIHAEGLNGGNAGIKHYLTFLDSLTTREGVARELSARITCGCLAVVEKRASPAAVAAALRASARAVAEGMAVAEEHLGPLDRLPLDDPAALRNATSGTLGALLAEAQARHEAAGGAPSRGGRGGVPPCAVCGVEARLSCSKCKAVSYCNVECQKRAWPEHKAGCSSRK